MLPANELDQKLLVEGLAYSAVHLGGARLLPPERYAEEELTDSFDIEDPFHPTSGSVDLPQNWAGSMHRRIADSVELVLEWWELDRVLPRAPASTAPPVRIAALVTVAATVVFVVAGVLVGAAALGSAVRADGPVVPPKSVVSQQDALTHFAVEWATSHRSDMTFTMEDAATAGEPEPETSAAEQRRIARAERAERRRERARRRARAGRR
jgi:hypothetical protein